MKEKVGIQNVCSKQRKEYVEVRVVGRAGNKQGYIVKYTGGFLALSL